ncbi:hypothetical protein BGZ96_009740 [Linnemannia gamsii]|uniref:F-box domain-containing protein n=1 Tax=Linnemannia gamsii TaxID=64522 RepID=A0ABQ7JXQ0_9FUNG|nr:hypothetical protein BGZ96_009740 [Linnemannia gamsii]
MAHITDLPIEILTIIVTVYIYKRPHIRATILTCRLFHQQFNHLLWTYISLCTSSKSPSADALKSHANLVRRLFHEEILPWEYYNITFPHLDNLGLWVSVEDPLKEEASPRWSSFLALNPSVCEIKIFTGASLCLKDLWDTIIASPHSHKRLTINGSDLVPISQQTSVNTFWGACTQFEEIEYHGRERLPLEGFEGVDFSRIKRFHYSPVVNVAEPLRLDWIGKLYNLRALKYSSEYDNPIPLNNFAVLAAIPAWPLLESLELGPTSGSDGEFAIMLHNLPPLRQWSLRTGDFGPASFTQLRDRHFDNLTTLRMSSVTTFTGPMALEALSGCPNLEVFKACCISLKDLRQVPQPWICRRLKQLKVFFVANTEDSKSDTVTLFRQLSRLELLEHIDNDLDYISATNARSIRGQAPKWRLDHGLTQLSTLSRLILFESKDTEHDMRLEDVQWMLEHWPRLIIFTCKSPSPDPATRDLISALLKQRKFTN